LSKFEKAVFYGGYDDYAVSKEKFTMEQAIDLFKIEAEQAKGKGKRIAVGNAFVRHRAGINEDGERQVGWWLEYMDHGRSCPVWAFHLECDSDAMFKDDYQYIEFD
jgi:hypothetical protein